MKTPEEATTLISSLWEYHPPDAVRAMRERDAEIRRDFCEKAKQVVQVESCAETMSHTPRWETRILAALDALLQEEETK